MEAAVEDNAERRGAERYGGVEQHGVLSTSVRPGHQATLIDISASGALIETGHRLLPGTRVELFLDRRRYRASVRGRVVRSSVVRVLPGSVCYRGAIGFEQHLPWFVASDRIDATSQVV